MQKVPGFSTSTTTPSEEDETLSAGGTPRKRQRDEEVKLTLEEEWILQWQSDLTSVILQGIQLFHETLLMLSQAYYGAESRRSMLPKVMPKIFDKPDIKTLRQFVDTYTPLLGRPLMELHLMLVHAAPNPVRITGLLDDLRQGANVFRDGGALDQLQYTEEQLRLFEEQRALLQQLQEQPQEDADIYPVWIFNVLTDKLLEQFCVPEGWGIMMQAAALISRQPGCKRYTLKSLLLGDTNVRAQFAGLCGRLANLTGDGMRKEPTTARRSTYYVSMSSATQYYHGQVELYCADFELQTRLEAHPVLDRFVRERGLYIDRQIERPASHASWEELKQHLKNPREFQAPPLNSEAGRWHTTMEHVWKYLPRERVIYKPRV